VTAEPYRDTIYIAALPEVVFEYFTKPEALVLWMGDSAVLDPRAGGEFTLHFGERCVEGRYLEVDVPRRLVISWGRRGSSSFPPQTSTLEVLLSQEGEGTRVSIVHSGLPDSETTRHALGWRHYLARLGVVSGGGSLPSQVTPAALDAD